MLRRVLHKNGQSILEYAIIASIIVGVVVVMTTYVFRSVQGAQQKVSDYSDE